MTIEERFRSNYCITCGVQVVPLYEELHNEWHNEQDVIELDDPTDDVDMETRA